MSSDKVNPNNNVFERIFRLWATICKMIVDGTRDPYKLAEILQSFVDQPFNVIKKAAEKVARRLVKHVGEAIIPATVTRNVVRDELKMKEDGGTYSFLGSNLVYWFAPPKSKTELVKGKIEPDKGKIEDASPEHTLCYGEVEESSLDEQIIEELGGEEKVEATMADVKYLKNQSKKDLLTNGLANTFYIRDAKGILRANRLAWHPQGWKFIGYDRRDPSGCPGGSRVFYRKTEVAPSKNFATGAISKPSI